MKGSGMQRVVEAQVVADPVTQAMIGPLREAVRLELDEHLPKLTYSVRETQEILGLGQEAVLALVSEGKLRRVAHDRSPITTVSILQLVGWPLAAAPLAAPLSAVPA